MPPIPESDVATLLADFVAAVEADLFFVVDEVDEGLNHLEIGAAELDCGEVGSYTIGTAIRRAELESVDQATAGFTLAFATFSWDIVIGEFATADEVETIIALFAEAAAQCPAGTREIPLTDVNGDQATDEAGNPIFVTANLATDSVELEIAGTSAASALDIEYVDAAGDGIVYHAAFQRGPFLVYIEGQESEVNLRRLIDVADQVLRAASR